MDRKISELDQVLNLDEQAEFPLSQDNGGTPTTFKAKLTQLAAKIAEAITFSNLITNDKRIIGAINEAARGSGASMKFEDLSDVDINNLQDGQFSKYDSTAQKWKNASIQEADVTDLVTDLADKADKTDLEYTDSASGTIANFENGGDRIPCKYLEVHATVGSAITTFNVIRSGINACDEVFESGSINTSGADVVDATRIRTANYCPCAEIEYYVVIPTGKTVAFRFYSLDKSHISGGNITMSVSGTMTPPEGAFYFRLVILDTTTYGNNLSVNVPSTYETYTPSAGTQEYTVTLPASMTDFMVDLISGKGKDFSTDTNFTITPIKVDTIIGTNSIYATVGNMFVGYFTRNAESIAEIAEAVDTDFHIYSTEERIIGKWIDGSDLYEQTITNVSLTHNSWTTIFDGSSIGATIVEYEGKISLSNDVPYCQLDYYRGTSEFACTSISNGNKLQVLANIVNPEKLLWATIRYTKSTSNTRSLNLSKGVEETQEVKTEEVKQEEVKEEEK